jgi:hypothetical protein
MFDWKGDVMSIFKTVMVAAVLSILPFRGTASAQPAGTIEAGTSIDVRTNEEINTNSSDGRVYSGSVDRDVQDSRGNIAIPRGSYVELLVRKFSDQFELDLDSVSINGERFAIQAQNNVISGRPDGLGANQRTGEFVGGGAIIGAIVGAIAGGGKGAAIGGGVGAAAGAGTQLATRGKNVSVPAESLVTFRLDQRLYTGVNDTGFSRNGNHYHSGYGTDAGNSTAYDAGLQAGRYDRDQNREFDSRTSEWNGVDLRDFQAAYERGYDETREPSAQAVGSIRIEADRSIHWRGPAASKVYVQVDNNPRQLFASGATGSQPAPWILSGHRYVFILEDSNGMEIARDENDLRESRGSRSRG